MASAVNIQTKIANLSAHSVEITARITELNAKILTLDAKIQNYSSEMRQAQSKQNAISFSHYTKMTESAKHHRDQLLRYVRQNMSILRKFALIIQKLKQRTVIKARGGKKANRRTRKN